jgi:signal transduction histidine kinase
MRQGAVDRSNSLLLSISSLVLFGLLMFVACRPGPRQPSLQAQNGVLDLRNATLDQRSMVMNGEWLIHPQQLLFPGDSARAFPARFPLIWNKLSANGKALSPIGYATYRLLVLLPARHEPLALTLPDAYSAQRLFVNGRLLAEHGKPDTSEATYIPKWKKETVLLPPGDTLHLLLQIANFSHAVGGPYEEMRIGPANKLISQQQKSNAVDFLLSGGLLLGGLFFFGLYLFGRHDKSILYFALFCIAYSYRIVGSGGYALHNVFPDVSWYVSIRLEYLTLFASVIFLIQYISHLYPEDANRQIIRWMIGFCLVFFAGGLFLPTTLFTRTINYFLITTFLFIAYGTYVFVRAIYLKRLASGYIVASLLVLLMILININLQHFGITRDSRLLETMGYVVFFFLQCLILAYRFSYELNKAKTLAESGLRAKSEFLSVMSHEIRTPLNSVIGMTHLMLKNNPREDQKEQLNVLLFSADNLLSIVNSILDYNKIEAGKIDFYPEEVDLLSIARNVMLGMRAYAKEKGIELRMRLDDKLTHKVMADPTRVAQVFTNLVHNAIKFTQEGWVCLSILVEDQTDKDVTVKVMVEDTGIGIEEQKQRFIFERFTQADSSTSRRFGGTGLGLAISRLILERQGAQLQLQSEAGKGSTFYFTLTYPLSKKEANTANTDLQKTVSGNVQENTLNGAEILLVEDNEMNILVTESFLKKWGARVEVARNGEEAIQKLDTDRHRLILMDMHMPVMDGYEATKIIRDRGDNIPIVALTATVPSEIESKTFSTYFNGIIVKPFNPRDLYNVVYHHTVGS